MDKFKNPKIKTSVVHSQTKSAWNIIGEQLGGKYKIARVPYLVCDNQELSDRNRIEAREHAEFISICFNNSDNIAKAFAPVNVAKCTELEETFKHCEDIKGKIPCVLCKKKVEYLNKVDENHFCAECFKLTYPKDWPLNAIVIHNV